jgi:hypothetical protein
VQDQQRRGSGSTEEPVEKLDITGTYVSSQGEDVTVIWTPIADVINLW